MSIFGISSEKMKETSSVFTLTEIHQQPSTWKKTCAQIAACREELQAFLDQVLKAEDFDIVLTGVHRCGGGSRGCVPEPLSSLCDL